MAASSLTRRKADSSVEKVIKLMLGLVLSFGTVVCGQVSTNPNAKLVRRIELAGSSYDTTSEIGIDLGDVHAHGSGDRVAVRACSKQPMLMALATSAASPKGVARYLIDFYGYSPERVIFLRSEKCLGSNSLVAATEFWAIPQGAAPPPSVEAVKSCQVLIDPLGVQGFSEKRQAYEVALQKVPLILREKPNAIAVVLGYYFNKPGRVMKRRLDEAGKFLAQSGLRRDRYFIQLMPWTGEYSLSYPKPRNPTVLILEMKNDCRVNASADLRLSRAQH